MSLIARYVFTDDIRKISDLADNVRTRGADMTSRDEMGTDLMPLLRAVYEDGKVGRDLVDRFLDRWVPKNTWRKCSKETPKTFGDFKHPACIVCGSLQSPESPSLRIFLGWFIPGTPSIEDSWRDTKTGKEIEAIWWMPLPPMPEDET